VPTENELKYVLNLDCEVDLVSSDFKYKKFLLLQGYLAFAKGMTLRLRSSQLMDRQKLIEHPKRKLCYKQKVNDRVIEIEKKINQRDFNDLWDSTLNRVEKQRYVVDFGKSVWEIDFFKYNHNETYFALAEHEMPEGQKEPDYIPSFISKNLVYAVPPDKDDDFSTKRLACARHAKKVYKELINAQKVIA
jgi:CYTH domain-containing protein